MFVQEQGLKHSIRVRVMVTVSVRARVRIRDMDRVKVILGSVSRPRDFFRTFFLCRISNLMAYCCGKG